MDAMPCPSAPLASLRPPFHMHAQCLAPNCSSLAPSSFAVPGAQLLHLRHPHLALLQGRLRPRLRPGGRPLRQVHGQGARPPPKKIGQAVG